MRNFIFAALLFGVTAYAGTNNLPTETSSVIQRAHVNKFKTALSGDLVPRDSSGNVVSAAASLGSQTYRFDAIWGDTHYFMKAASSNYVSMHAPVGLAAIYDLTLPAALPASTLPFTLSSAGVFSTGTITTAQITDANVTNAKMAANSVTTSNITDANVTLAKMAANSVNSSNIVDATIVTADLADGAVTQAKLATKTVQKGTVLVSPFTTTSSSDTDTGITVTITTTGRPVVIGLYAGLTNDGSIENTSTTAGARIRFWRDSTGLDYELIKSANNHNYPPGSFHYVDTGASAGSHTYKLTASSISGLGTVTVNYLGMYAYEL